MSARSSPDHFCLTQPSSTNFIFTLCTICSNSLIRYSHSQLFKHWIKSTMFADYLAWSQSLVNPWNFDKQSKNMSSGYSSNKLPVFIMDVYCTLAYCHFVYATRYSIAERASFFRVSGFHPEAQGEINHWLERIGRPSQRNIAAQTLHWKGEVISQWWLCRINEKLYEIRQNLKNCDGMHGPLLCYRLMQGYWDSGIQELNLCAIRKFISEFRIIGICYSWPGSSKEC